MKTVCVLLLAAGWLVLVLGNPVSTQLYDPEKVNKHVPAVCIAEKGGIITEGPECQKNFLFVRSKATWIEAFNNCEEEGKQLVSIRNRREQELLENAMVKANVGMGKGQLHMWMGATDQREENKFRWIGDDMAEMKYTNFEVGEPNNINGNEHCLEIKTRFQWNDYNCDAKKAYICEYYGEPEE